MEKEKRSEQESKTKTLGRMEERQQDSLGKSSKERQAGNEGEGEGLSLKKNDLRGNEISGKAMNWGYFHRG